MEYEIFKLINHQRIVNTHDDVEEIFDLYQCGIFKNNSIEENIEFVELQPESTYRPHIHKNSSAIIYIIAGDGLFQLENDFIKYEPELRIHVPAKMRHGFKTNTLTLFLSIQSPPIINPKNGEIDLCYEEDL